MSFTFKIKNSDLAFAGIVFVVATIILTLVQLLFPAVLSSALFSLNKGLVDPNIVVVAIDEKTVNSDGFKRYQDISRCNYTTLLRNITHSDPKAVGVDVFFAQKSAQESCDTELVSFLRKNGNVLVGTEYNEKEKRIIPLFDGKEALESIALVNTNGSQAIEEFLSFFSVQHESDTKNSVLLYTK